MEDNLEKVSQAAKSVTILQSAFAAGMVIFAVIVFAISNPDHCHFTWSDPFTIIAIVFTAVAIPGSILRFRAGVRKAQSASDIDQKIALYAAAFIGRTALLEANALVSIILALVSNCYNYYLFTGIAFIAFVSQWITANKIKSDLDIY